MLAAAMLLTGAAASAQGAGNGLLPGFLPNGEYLLEMEGRRLAAAEVFQSDGARAFLVMAPELAAPVLLRPGLGRVDTVHLMKVNRRPDGSIDLLPDALIADQGRFQVVEGGVAFAVDGRRLALKVKPALLGLQDPDGLEAYNPVYGRTAEAYTPSESILDRLRVEAEPVRVRVFFGTWCPHCTEMVPRVMRVARELTGSRVDFEFYGLPEGIIGDPEAKEFDIHGVPTGVVFLEGEEIGRIEGASFKIPELAIQDILEDARGTS